ncbi:hypothetical protein [Streptomyces sp. NPDC003247]|uniref:hypothetical protein n=1 Tax=Streptomyces sp. NPDC003247 TaxID=3364677 RepID=UPI0036AB378D
MSPHRRPWSPALTTVLLSTALLTTALTAALSTALVTGADRRCRHGRFLLPSSITGPAAGFRRRP